jgi:hypothetical protein
MASLQALRAAAGGERAAFPVRRTGKPQIDTILSDAAIMDAVC